MIIHSTLYLLILLLPAELQTIVDNLGASEYKVRTAAFKTAKNLNENQKKALIKELKKSKDPELTETAKVLYLTLPESISKEQALKYVLEDKYSEIEEALKANSDSFNETYSGKVTLLDFALFYEKYRIAKLLKKYKIPRHYQNHKTMEVLVVKSDTWESLAKDFNSTVDLIITINRGIELSPGGIIRIPKSN